MSHYDASIRSATGNMHQASNLNLNVQPAFDSAIAWRSYAGYLETELAKMGKGFSPIANDVLRVHPPRPIKTIIYE